MEKKKYYKISDISSLLQITPRTIRFYEQQGLLDSVVRTAGGMRLFTDQNVELIQKIKNWQKNELLTLDQIKKLIKTPKSDEIDKSEKIAIVTDSTASLPKIILDDYDIFVLPLYITLDDKIYKDGVDINAIDFFSKVKGNNYKASSAPPNVEDFIDIYHKIFNQKFTHIISLHIASHWSKTYENSALAATEFGNKITVFDSFNSGLGMGIQVFNAAKMAKKQKKIEIILNDLREKRKRCWQTLFINSLDFFTQNIDKTSIQGELLNSLLDYKPILFYDPDFGKFQVNGRASHTHEGITLLYQSIKDYEKENGKIIQYIGITHSYLYQEAFELMKLIKHNYPKIDVIISEASPIINTYVGFYSMALTIC